MIMTHVKKIILQKGIPRKHRRGPVKLMVRDGKTSHSGGTRKSSLERSAGIVQREKGGVLPTQDHQSFPRVLSFLVPVGTDHTTGYNYNYTKPSKINPSLRCQQLPPGLAKYSHRILTLGGYCWFCSHQALSQPTPRENSPRSIGPSHSIETSEPPCVAGPVCSWSLYGGVNASYC